MADFQCNGLLIDISGVVVEGKDRPIDGSLEAMARIEQSGVPYLFATNTTSRPRTEIARELRSAGFAVSSESRILTPFQVAQTICADKGLNPLCLVRKSVAAEIDTDPGRPYNAVVVGDLGDELTSHLLEEAFEAIHNGAVFLALAKNRDYVGPSGKLIPDMGLVVAGLEYSTNSEATILGKPNALFFDAALKLMGVVAGECVMIGDDLEADVIGAVSQGMHAVLVETGKFRAEWAAKAGEYGIAVAPNLKHALDLPLLSGL
ncbi:HAD-IIA family hydrolase [Hoeflea sp. TYP-13]|uniref:HAD-IIA family hydrolase n=1 Tax=Hoeflea sp. TYP-13 TaxID=3230023 RepID=UPI0034C64279